MDGRNRSLSSAEKDEKFGSEMLLKLRSTSHETDGGGGGGDDNTQEIEKEDQSTHTNIAVDMGAESV